MRARPTSLGRCSNSGSIAFRPAFPVSLRAWAAAFRTETVLADGDTVGDFFSFDERYVNVDRATPGYLRAKRSMA